MEFDTLINSFRLFIGADSFLFWLFLIGIIVASCQDLKRREVDNWLNLFLLVSGLAFIFYRAIFERNAALVFHVGFALVIMFVIMNLFYYGRVFAGGDAKLLVAMTAFFVGASFYLTLANIGIFLFLLMLSGSIYGLLYSFVLYSKNFRKVNKEIKKGLEGMFVKFVFVVGVCLMLLGFLNFVFLLFGIMVFVFPLLYVFAKGLENVSMIKSVSGRELREGDWLVEDVRVKGRVIKADWDGLSLEDIKLLKGRKEVKIKDGLPFVPAFLIAFLLYSLSRDWIVGFFAGVF